MLLSPALAQTTGVWADLGCGDGVFTRLLAEWLPAGSLVYAVDRDAAALRRLQQALAGSNRGVTVLLRQADFTHPLDLPPLDGMLLANSLHFVRHKEPLCAVSFHGSSPRDGWWSSSTIPGAATGQYPFPCPQRNSWH
jgi:trans-aconitate methyltransferase